MKFVSNAGQERVIDLLRPGLMPGHRLDIVSPVYSLFAYAEIQSDTSHLAHTLTPPEAADLALLGSPADRAARNRLQVPWLARQFAHWIDTKAEVRRAKGAIPQGAMVMRDSLNQPLQAVLGSFGCSTDGLGITPGNPLSLIQAAENPAETQMLSQWFDQQWSNLQAQPDAKAVLVAQLNELAAHRDPTGIYALILYSLFANSGDGMDEDRIVKSATGIRNTVVWKKLYRFQRDGVVGALDKLDRFGGCIIADSVGLGKTFEALAIIKYHELRNDRVLVLAPKRLRDNWTIYKSNDKRNVLAADRLNYDVLNRTDLSRDDGASGDIDLAHVNWGNYDLVVIDESHNFRNKKSPRQGNETRYDRRHVSLSQIPLDCCRLHRHCGGQV
ncbi:SNF2-related protein [Polaromonas sp.]|uniref:SNF2-related protein n=1 Tax=Polaromonas sp. TaxID=1869339 RepID=UPI0017CA611E|nr:SNF2-related protein [Polaromonas sp.]NMM08314.1 hypothetical protein [Polaromonas sp.]